MASAWGKAWGKAWGDAWGLLDVPYRTLDFKSQIFVQQILAHTYAQHQVESIVAYAERHNLSVLSAASSLYATQQDAMLTVALIDERHNLSVLSAASSLYVQQDATPTVALIDEHAALTTLTAKRENVFVRSGSRKRIA